MEKRTQIGFRCTPAVVKRLKQLALARETTVQALLDEALEEWLASRRESPVSPFAGLNVIEERRLADYLEAIRNGEADLVQLINQSIASTLRIARKYPKPDSEGDRLGWAPLCKLYVTKVLRVAGVLVH